MSSNDTQKADQIAYRFYTKLVLVVNNARSTFEEPLQGKGDKWFNLETPESDLFKDSLRLYRSISISNAAPAFELQVLLCVPELNNNQVLVHLAPDSSRVRVEPTPKYILLESWKLLFSPGTSGSSSDVAPSTIYKHGIPLFRSVYTLLRILPTWKLQRRLRRRMGGAGGLGAFTIQLRLRGEGSDDRVLGFDTPLTASSPPLSKESHDFPYIPHPMGTLTLSATYLTCPQFRLDDLESLLSSRFLSLDEGPDFTPTLIKNQQRDSLTTSPPGSLPLRTSLPRSPPSASIADRFVLPAPNSSRTAFPGIGTSVSPNNRPVALPPLRARRTSEFESGAASNISDGSSSRRSAGSGRDELVSRLRKESTTSAGGGKDLPSMGSSPAGSPLPIRRPNINPVHPFKTSTLSSAAGSASLHSPSPSLRQHSPLSGPSLPSRPPQLQIQPGHKSPGQPLPPSPIRTASSPVLAFGFKNSPPVIPSNLGGGAVASERSSLDGPTSASGKRYSSSFPHRYTAPGAVGGDGSPRSAVVDTRDASERPGSASFFNANTDDDDISTFVQDIDSRRPLRAAGPESRLPPRQPLGGATSPRRGDPGDLTGLSGTREPMLTSVSAVDEKLREMNEAFAASLAGLTRGPVSRVRSDSSPSGRARGGLRSPELEEPGLMMIGRGMRPRYGSMGSVRSGGSITSEEVIGKLELEEKRRSRGM